MYGVMGSNHPSSYFPGSLALFLRASPYMKAPFFLGRQARGIASGMHLLRNKSRSILSESGK
jgi:hypothetical protein